MLKPKLKQKNIGKIISEVIFVRINKKKVGIFEKILEFFK